MTSILKVLILLLTLSPAQAFDHSYKKFGKVLKRHVHFKGPQSYVDYQALKNNPKELNQVLNEWSNVSKEEYEKWSTEDKLAFLINAYNGFTLKLIIDNYPVKSIKDIGTFFSNPWKKEFFKIFGQKSHLDHIEHDLIRKNFKEPRIHFAVNCASLGCPSLAREPYQGLYMEKQLDEATKRFIQNRERNRFDGQKKIAYLSKIFDWYGDDFENMTKQNYKSFLVGIMPFFGPDSWKIEWLEYDWNLNDSPSPNKEP